MVYYTNYKQIARITLKSDDAIMTSNAVRTMNTNLTYPVITEYAYNINLPTITFNKFTRLAMESFSIIHACGDYNNKVQPVSDVYIKNFSKPLNVWHSSQKYGTVLFTNDLGHDTTVYNHDIINNSIDITGNTNIFKNEPLRIFVDTKMRDDNGIDIEGCHLPSRWAMTLIVYDYDPPENKKDVVSNNSAEIQTKPS